MKITPDSPWTAQADLLSGIDVVELSSGVAGAYCGAVLAQLGARVARCCAETRLVASAKTQAIMQEVFHGAKGVIEPDGLDKALVRAHIVIVESAAAGHPQAERMRALGADEVMVFPFGLEAMPLEAGPKTPLLFFATCVWRGALRLPCFPFTASATLLKLGIALGCRAAILWRSLADPSFQSVYFVRYAKIEFAIMLYTAWVVEVRRGRAGLRAGFRAGFGFGCGGQQWVVQVRWGRGGVARGCGVGVLAWWVGQLAADAAPGGGALSGLQGGRPSIAPHGPLNGLVFL